MNESLIAIAGIVVPIVGGVVAWVMNTFDKRISVLENEQDVIHEKKLDKEDYYRDQGALAVTLRNMSSDIKEVLIMVSRKRED